MCMLNDVFQNSDKHIICTAHALARIHADIHILQNNLNVCAIDWMVSWMDDSVVDWIIDTNVNSRLEMSRLEIIDADTQDRFVYWLKDWRNGWLSGSHRGWPLTEWSIQWLTQWLTEWMAGWVSEGLRGLLSGWLSGWLSHRLSGQLSSWLSGRLSDWVRGRLGGRLSGQVSDWLNG